MLDQIRIILVQPTYAGNIGSVARAMKNMGLYELYMINPQEYPHPNARAMASGAGDILDNAKFANSLAEALVDCDYALATSARDCAFGWPIVTPRQAGLLVKQKLQQESYGKIAIVFGQERIGLDVRDLQLCDAQLQIPASEVYPVLNLAQAVQIITYELRQAALTATELTPKTQPPEAPPAQFADREGFYQHIEEVMLQVGFLHPKYPKNLMPRIRRLYNKAELDTKEINILRGILTAVQQKLAKREECEQA